jgi:hypothetical protein
VVHGLAHVRGVVQVVGGQGAQHGEPLLGLAAREAHHQGLGRRPVVQDHLQGAGHLGAGEHSAEHVEEHRLHPGVAEEQGERGADAVQVRAAAQVHEVGRGQAVQVQVVHGGHGQARAVGGQAHPPGQAVEGQPGGARLVLLAGGVLGRVEALQVGVAGRPGWRRSPPCRPGQPVPFPHQGQGFTSARSRPKRSTAAYSRARSCWNPGQAAWSAPRWKKAARTWRGAGPSPAQSGWMSSAAGSRESSSTFTPPFRAVVSTRAPRSRDTVKER